MSRQEKKQRKQRKLTVEFDVTDLTQKQINRLMLEVCVQAEASDDDEDDAHPDVPVLSTKIGGGGGETKAPRRAS